MKSMKLLDRAKCFGQLAKHKMETSLFPFSSALRTTATKRDNYKIYMEGKLLNMKPFLCIKKVH